MSTAAATQIGKRILVVDDEALIAMLLEDMLVDLGCAVVGPAASVAAAMALIGSTAIDAALVDVHLAGTSSDPVALALQAHNIPFAFVTGSVARRNAVFADVPTLQKPFAIAELERTIGHFFA